MLSISELRRLSFPDKMHELHGLSDHALIALMEVLTNCPYGIPGGEALAHAVGLQLSTRLAIRLQNACGAGVAI